MTSKIVRHGNLTAKPVFCSFTHNPCPFSWSKLKVNGTLQQATDSEESK